MNPQRIYLPAHGRASQRGQAMIFVAVLLLLGISAVIYTTVSSTSVSIANRQADNTARTLAQVKEALIGWSAARTPPDSSSYDRPGDLPCPDVNPLDGYEDGSCVAGALGRVPWKTLGIPEPKDAAGETLWYTIAGPFRRYNPSIPLTTVPITSDTLGNITVYQDNPSTTLTTPASTATTITTQAVAVIFAPGAPMGTQDRSSTATMACTAPSGTYPRNICASNYLETWSSVNNSSINGPFIQARSSNEFNDRLLVITNADLMPIVEQRVAREMKSLLASYKATVTVYPWADNNDGNSNAAQNRHRFPCGTALPVPWGNSTPVTPVLPNWLKNGCGSNSIGWSHIMYYAAGRTWLENIACDTGFCIAPSLTVNGVAGFELVLLTPGAASASPRPNPGAGCTTSPPGTWPDVYFRDQENCDDDDENFVTPTSTAYNRDRIYTVP